MPSLLTLLLFCDFLASRLHTSNLVLLRRILSDFFAGNEHTLQDFIRLGASVVTVVPMERKGRQHQEEAARLLSQQQHMTESSPLQLCVFRYLAARVATKNIFWLRDMFQEFCSGGGTLVREFVRRGNEVISVIPVDIQALQVNPLLSTLLLMQPTVLAAVSESPMEATLVELEQKKQQSSDGESPEEDDQSEDEDDDEITTLAELASVASMPTSLDDLRACIMEAQGRLEEQEPWKQVFDPDTLPFLFSEAKRPKLAGALKTFWRKHARAVWERRFWGPLVNLPDRSRQFGRKRRQSNARTAFEDVMSAVYEAIGVSFFVQLDRRAKPHKGWWYVKPVQDLVIIAQRVGLAACLNYLGSQALERFPAAPGGRILIASPNNGKSESMWATTSAMQPILTEICAIKAAKKPSKSKNKK